VTIRRQLALAFLLATTATAAMAGSGWTNFAQITQLNQQPAAGAGAELLFVETTVSENPSGCSFSTGFYLSVTDDRHKRLAAMLLAAQISGQSVRFYVTGTCHVPWGYSEIDGLAVQ
jgi:hypothetical protein